MLQVTLVCFVCEAANAHEEGSLADLSLEQLMDLHVAAVHGASRYDQKVTQAPASVSIVTAEEIRRYGHRTLADVLASVRGLMVVNDRNYTYLGVRGFHRPGDYNTRVLVTIDGHRLNDSLFDGGTIAREGMVDVELIDRVEVIRGPGSSIYGSSAFFGVINVVTRRGAQLEGLELAGESGTYETHQARITHGGHFASGFEWLVSGSHYTSAGVPRLYFPEFDPGLSSDPRAAAGGVARRLDGEDHTNLFARVHYGDFSLSAFYSDRIKQVPTASFDTIFNHPGERTTDYRSYLDLAYERSLGANLKLQARLSYDDYTYFGTYPYDYSEPGQSLEPVLLHDAAIARWIGTQWQMTAQFARHRVVLGAEIRESLREYQRSYEDLAARVYYIDRDTASTVAGVFAQDEITLREDLTLTAGLRLDHYPGNFGSTLTPRLGLIYNVSPAATLKLLAGEAFRAPNPYERHYFLGQRDFAPLDPETIRTYEVAFERYFVPHYRTAVSVYQYEIDDLITEASSPQSSTHFANLASVKARGIELEAEAAMGEGARVRASYALQKTRTASGEELSGSPRQLGKLSLTLPLYGERVFAGLELQYQSSSLTIGGTRAGSFLLTNLALTAERFLLDRLHLSIGFNNLLDVRYGYPGADGHLQRVIEQNGRTLEGKIGCRF